MKKKIALACALVALVALGALAAYVVVKLREAANVHGSSTEEFISTEVVEKTLPQTTATPRPTKTSWREGGVVWPMYGFGTERARSATGFGLRPPYRVFWRFRASALLEFPPAVAYGRVYVANNAGVLFAIRAQTGYRKWRYKSHRCSAAAPAVANGIVYMAFLNRPPCNAEGSHLDGQVVALDAKTGRVRWRRTIGPSETSPLVSRGLVYVGDWRGKVYAFAARTGKLRWTFSTNGKVKGAIAQSGRRLFVGSYDGHLYSLDARTGRRIWRASAQTRLGPTGTFYSTPAVAYGRVYIGSTDRRVYSYGATTGALRWSYGTGGYVYSSPAVWHLRVYIGSHDGNLYCFDAATGDVHWKFKTGGPISGSPTVIDGIVYFATVRGRTFGLNALTGKQVWSFRDGQYTPVVADKERLYLAGYKRLYALVPK